MCYSSIFEFLQLRKCDPNYEECRFNDRDYWHSSEQSHKSTKRSEIVRTAECIPFDSWNEKRTWKAGLKHSRRESRCFKGFYRNYTRASRNNHLFTRKVCFAFTWNSTYSQRPKHLHLVFWSLSSSWNFSSVVLTQLLSRTPHRTLVWLPGIQTKSSICLLLSYILTNHVERNTSALIWYRNRQTLVLAVVLGVNFEKSQLFLAWQITVSHL